MFDNSQTTELARMASMFKTVAKVLDDSYGRPHGPAAEGDTKRLAGQALVRMSGGNKQLAATVWKLIEEEFGYVPYAAAVALIKANSNNLVPHVEAPEVT